MLPLTLLLALSPAPAAPWRSYEVYQPQVERHFVVNIHTQKLKYNHDSTIAWFGDRWFCLWNANEPPAEGRPGQLNYVSTSPDGKAWSAPEPAFSDQRRSDNPVPCPTGTQWQPNLIIVAGELWAVWSQNSKDDYTGCYLSRLTHPDGKWVNRRLTWDGDSRPEIDGRRFRVFPTQNPIRLRSGRVLAPVTIIGPQAADAPESVKSWWATEKRNTVLYTDDAGQTWHCSPGAVQPQRTWAQWEPTVWELPDGTVMMLARNNDFRGRAEDGPRPAEMLLWSRSADGGATWTPHEYVPLETVASRMHVLLAGGDRFMLVHNDWPADRFVHDRNNLALFFTRGAGVDFIAGPGVTGHEPVVAYPQMWIKDNAVAISYSQGLQYRSIKVAHISPLPEPDRYYLFPRSNLGLPPAPERLGDVFRFAGGQRIATTEPVDPGKEAFSAGVWLRPEGGGVILDTRSTRPPAGFVWGLRSGEGGGLAPFIFLHTPERNISPALELPHAEWSYLGVNVDAAESTVTFHVNDEAERVPFAGPLPNPLRGTTGHVGYKRFEGSQLAGLIGELRALALYPGARLTAEEHHWLHNRFCGALQRPPLTPVSPPSAPPAVWLDPANTEAFARDFALPEGSTGRVEIVALMGGPSGGARGAGFPAREQGGPIRPARQALRISGEASAGVDLDENRRDRGDTVELAFRFRIEAGDEHVLCTVGDANLPVRVMNREGQVVVAYGAEEYECGALRPGEWNEVQLSTAGERTTVALNAGEATGALHAPVANWLYLGQGYRTGAIPGSSAFVVDVGSVRSRVNTTD